MFSLLIFTFDSYIIMLRYFILLYRKRKERNLFTNFEGKLGDSYD